jgi:hypothetical protein
MGDDDGAEIGADALPQLVLQPSDLTPDWTRFDAGRQRLADAPPGDRADPTRFGREGGWIARYRRPGSSETAGPLVVESRADLFESVGGAEDDFDAALADIERLGQAGSESIDTSDLGDEARGVGSVGEPGQLQFFTIVWRDGNVTATLTANGFHGRLLPEHVVRLAEKQQARMARAAE